MASKADAHGKTNRSRLAVKISKLMRKNNENR